MNWKNETLRDIEALGSFTFYIVVASRGLIGRHLPFLAETAAALGLSIVLWHLVKLTVGIKPSSHSSNSMILLLLVGSFYHDLLFSVFLIALISLVIYAHVQLRKHRWTEIITGMLIGLVSGGAVLWATWLLM